jgi:hypothetical protein
LVLFEVQVALHDLLPALEIGVQRQRRVFYVQRHVAVSKIPAHFPVRLQGQDVHVAHPLECRRVEIGARALPRAEPVHVLVHQRLQLHHRPRLGTPDLEFEPGTDKQGRGVHHPVRVLRRLHDARDVRRHLLVGQLVLGVGVFHVQALRENDALVEQSEVAALVVVFVGKPDVFENDIVRIHLVECVGDGARGCDSRGLLGVVLIGVGGGNGGGVGGLTFVACAVCADFVHFFRIGPDLGGVRHAQRVLLRLWRTLPLFFREQRQRLGHVKCRDDEFLMYFFERRRCHNDKMLRIVLLVFCLSAAKPRQEGVQPSGSLGGHKIFFRVVDRAPLMPR